ncbi:unnamed protein product [Brachionus calyciflorus]|uniref:Ubiquitin-like protease family profile domain-containing protein n=1 Tax=Brachionus calyciflorus TaxID=104777 RepID=A0A813M001_9BILA|nr:unnamed protein product [Brachionus calyciflorus]
MDKILFRDQIFSFLDKEKTFAQYDRVRFRQDGKNQNGTIRWQCITCTVTLTTFNDEVTREPSQKHKSVKCTSLIPDHLECILEYENLKYLAKMSDDFKFSEEYKKSLMLLQAKFDNKSISEFWPNFSKAKSCCYKIRSSRKISEPKCPNKLTITEDQKFITINNQQQQFLKYDNNNRNGNRILIFYSDSAAELLENAEEYHLDEYLERSMQLIINEMPTNHDESIIKYFISQWLTGQFAPSICNHHKTDKRRTNNDVEGFHSGLLKSNLCSSANRRCYQNLNIELLHEEFYQKEISFNEYFEKITHQMLSPYEQFLENNDKDIEHLLNNFKNIDFMSLLNNKINQVKNLVCEEKIKLENWNKTELSTERKSKKRNLHDYDNIEHNNLKKPKMEKETIVIDESEPSICVLNSGLFLSSTQWLSSSHIDLALDFFSSHFNKLGTFNDICYWTTWRIQKLLSETSPVYINQNSDQIFILNVNNSHWIMLTNIDPYVINSDLCIDQEQIKKTWFVYDSLNDSRNLFVVKPIMKFLYPEQLYHNLNMVSVIQQEGSNDCGLFSIAYAYDLSLKKDPSNLKYDQAYMRKCFNLLVKINFLSEFQSVIVPDRQRYLSNYTI